MKLVDTNLLLYAVNADERDHHVVARRWLDGALTGGALVGFPWLALVGFVRIVTHPSIVPNPLSQSEAMDLVDDWLGARAARAVHPGPQHAVILRRLLDGAERGGNLTNDAHLAALAIEHKATVVTFDGDFGRFPGVRSERPR